MGVKFKPLLAATYTDKDVVQFPVIASPKIDGFRCLTPNKSHGIPDTSTRALKPIKCTHIRFKTRDYPGLDGEIVCGDPLDPLTWDRTKSMATTHEAKPDFTLYAFDLTSLPPETPFEERIQELRRLQSSMPPHIKYLEHFVIRDMVQLASYEEHCVAQGWEGVMYRVPHGRYKYGRSTMNESFLVKWKRMERDVAEIVGFEEAFANENEATLNELGHTSRSSSKAGKRAKNTLGAFILRSKKWDVTFNIGTGEGLTAELRQAIWDDRPGYLGRKIWYDYQIAGSKVRPRIPSYKGFVQ